MKKSKKFLAHKHKQAKKKAKFLLRHPLVLPVSVFFVIVFFGLGMFVTVGATTGGAKDKKIVDIYVDDEKQTLSTRAKTVEDLLERLDIELIEEDVVEPSKETALIEDNTQINIYRARPVEIISGDRIITVLSAQQAPRLLAAEAGISLRPEDEAVFGLPEDNSKIASGASERLIITRSIEVQLNVYGELTKLRTTASTVDELLIENGVSPQATDNVQPANSDTKIKSGMLISINKEGFITEAVTEPIPYGNETREDPNLSVGQSRLLTAGGNGEKAVIYELRVGDDGEEIERRELQTVVLLEPVNEVKLVGTKPATLSATLNVSDDKIALMSAAGISPSDYPYVDYIVSRESNWRPGALNASSGAYGLCQSLPASKMASAGSDYLTNPVTQLRWCASYASRYGGWQGAYNAWLVQHWW